MSGNEKTETRERLCLPGAESWELWGRVGGGEGLERLRDGRADPGEVSDRGSPARFAGAEVFGIPVASAFSAPMWVASGDDELVEGALTIQLEAQGLMPSNREGVHLVREVVERGEQRTLVAVTVLPDGYMTELPRESPDVFLVTPELYRLADDAVTVWKELGKLVFAVTRSDEVVYFQGTTARELDDEVAREIVFTVMQLASQGVVDGVRGAEVWLDEGEVGEAAVSRMEGALGVGVRVAERPCPLMPADLDGVGEALLPEFVAVARRDAKKRAQFKRIASVAALVYIVVLTVFGVRYFVKQGEVAAAEEEVARLTSAAGWIPGMKLRWMDYQQTVDPDTYPLETLRRIYAKMPPTGVRFKRYDDTVDRVVIVGEAQDQTAAIRFKNAISNSPDLKRYRWSGPPPKIGRSRTAEFTLTGVLDEEGAVEE